MSYNFNFSNSNKFSTDNDTVNLSLYTIKDQLKYIYGMPNDIGAEFSLGWKISSEFINKPLTSLKNKFKISLKNKIVLFKENHLYIPPIQPTNFIEDKFSMIAFHVIYINLKTKLNYKYSKKNFQNELFKINQIIELFFNNFFVVNEIEFELDKKFKNYGFFNKYVYEKKEFKSLKTSIHIPLNYEGEICFKIIDLDNKNLESSLHKLLKSQFNNYKEDIDLNESIETIKQKISVLKLIDY